MRKLLAWAKTQGQFTWETHHPYQSFTKDLWFRNKGYVYDVFSEEISVELNGQPDGALEYGVRVFKEGDDKFTRTLACEARPTGQFDLNNVL